MNNCSCARAASLDASDGANAGTMHEARPLMQRELSAVPAVQFKSVSITRPIPCLSLVVRTKVRPRAGDIGSGAGEDARQCRCIR
jgi:hypothetical protein